MLFSSSVNDVWLFKVETDVFSIFELKRKSKTVEKVNSVQTLTG